MTHSDKLRRLREAFTSYGKCVVAFSGGTDSSVLAATAVRTLGADSCQAAMAITPMTAAGEPTYAQRIAEEIGIPLYTVEVNPLTNDAFRRNSIERCYHCKTMIFRELRRIANGVTILAGDHIDDAGSYRPGRRALDELGIRRPFVECGFTKSEIRKLGHHYGLSNADRPATPCLATRFAYGLELDFEKLRSVDEAEHRLRELGVEGNLRVRIHAGSLARLEVSESELANFADPKWRRNIVDAIQNLGFRYVVVDMEGFRSGSFDTTIK